MPKNKYVIKNDFYCTKCGKKGIPIARTLRHLKNSGHLKKLFCLYCQDETNHVEVRATGGYSYEDFLMEFELGRFVDGKKIPTKDLMPCSKKDCKYNKHAHCWNSNYSYDCPHRPKKAIENKEE